MPIRPENKHHYGAAWRETRKAILARAGNRCEWCGRPDRRVVGVFRCGCWRVGYEEPDLFWTHRRGDCCIPAEGHQHGRLVRTILTIAHLNHTPGDDRHENLAALCQRCHLRYDREHHAQTRKRNKEDAR